MNNIMDQYHRAGKRFAAEITDTKESARLRDAISKSGRGTEKLAHVSFDVTIDDEWIDRIERALPHLEAAIREDSQFIKSEGNVTSIERVRKVSRASVEHLARHSEMITHVPDEGDDLIPDKLKVYENESNFAVYENRVLYMVLCYTRDFLDYRYFRISQAWNERSSDLSFRKELRLSGRKISFEAKLFDQAAGMTEEEENTARKVARIESAVGAVAMLLAMPLMKEVALAPMVTPPITRTNVLRMDVHFREVVALYDYLSTYTDDGYKLERHENLQSPFSDDMEKEITEWMMFCMYLNYKYGKDVADELEERYIEEEERRKVEAFLASEERLNALREKLRVGNVSAEEYWEVLEQSVNARDQIISELKEQLSVAEEWKAAAAEAEERESALRERIDQCRKETGEANRRAVTAQNESMAEQDKLRAEILALKESIAAETEKNRFLNARVIGMLEEYGIRKPNVDYSEKEEFLELEKEREAFERVYEKNWKKAKKKIRKRVLWGKR